MRLSTRRQLAAAIGTVAALPVAAILYLNAGIARAAVVQLWPVKPFTQCTPDPRIAGDPGAEDHARALAPLPPAAIAKVERAQYGPFAGPVTVYVYATVHMAPVLRDRRWLHAPILTHELSHLKMDVPIFYRSRR